MKHRMKNDSIEKETAKKGKEKKRRQRARFGP
jgi:hypothetical protein